MKDKHLLVTSHEHVAMIPGGHKDILCVHEQEKRPVGKDRPSVFVYGGSEDPLLRSSVARYSLQMISDRFITRTPTSRSGVKPLPVDRGHTRHQAQPDVVPQLAHL
jgi:hypothetical protein